jgi:hypothetical protein
MCGTSRRLCERLTGIAPVNMTYEGLKTPIPLVCPTDFDRHVVAVVPRVVSAIEKVAEIRIADRDRAQ